ncbi:recombinase family protein, partial [Sphingomonas sp. 179-A 2A2 NHS]|uniref:recombinase family protein n=1 Tax=Sphingomonas sp. 179-A 2A2 NHS TaxID=3374290 RepID=UPI00387938FF
MAVIAAVAEFEKDLLVERTQAGLRRAVEQGKKLGRRHALSENVRANIRAERLAGTSLGILAKKYGVSRSAIQRIERAGT